MTITVILLSIGGGIGFAATAALVYLLAREKNLHRATRASHLNDLKQAKNVTIELSQVLDVLASQNRSDLSYIKNKINKILSKIKINEEDDDE